VEQDETGVARSQHVVHVLPPGDARVAGVLGPIAEASRGLHLTNMDGHGPMQL